MTALESRLEILKHNGLLLNPHDCELYTKLQQQVDGERDRK